MNLSESSNMRAQLQVSFEDERPGEPDKSTIDELRDGPTARWRSDPIAGTAAYAGVGAATRSVLMTKAFSSASLSPLNRHTSQYE